MQALFLNGEKMRRHEKKHVQYRIDRFTNLTCLKDVALLLGVEPRSLSYILYFAYRNRDFLYTERKLRKKGGGERIIHAPSAPLKKIQSRLNKYLQDVYWEKKSVHGFLQKRSIISNATCHRRKRLVLNIDLKDFFPSIHFGRVFGLFKASPYSLPHEAAKVLAQIACTENHLPQGSPCSPIISNMICGKLDHDLEAFAKKYKLFYSRYADDISFSSNLKQFPPQICSSSGVISVIVGDELKEIITSNGFEINDQKVRLFDKNSRQEVTGLVVNELVNVPRTFIRNIRTMLHKWDVLGIEHVKKEYNETYKKINSKNNTANFYKALLGKINFVYDVRKNKSNDIFFKEKKKYSQNRKDITEKLYEKFYHLYIRDIPEVAIITEGKTDWMHLKAAFSSLSTWRYKYEPNFFEISNKHLPGGEANLLALANRVKDKAIPDFPKLTIIVFDRDNNGLIAQHGETGILQWSDNLFSMVLPSECNTLFEHFSIEFLYAKTVRQRKNKKGRRLFLSDEFDQNGIHVKTQKYRCPSLAGKLGAPKIVEDRVISAKKESKFNYTMSKADFAKLILNKKERFATVSFSHFRPIFDVISKIYTNHTK